MDAMQQLSNTGFTELEVVHTFMRSVDVVSTVRTLDSIRDYLELLELFYTDGERRVPLLPRLLEQGELSRYVVEVHGLKSAAANIGANDLSALAREHESAGREGRLDWVRANLEALTSACYGLLAEIRRVLDHWQFGRFAVEDLSGLPELREEERSERLRRALAALEDFESRQAAREVEELLGFALPEELREGLLKVQSLLRIYDDDQAEAVLRELAGSGGSHG